MGIALILGEIVYGTELLVGDVTEAYNKDSPIGGNLLVGVWAGSIDGVLQPKKISVLAPQSGIGYKICFKAKTRDGLYSAHGELEAPPGIKRKLHISSYVKGNYLEQINQYSQEDFASISYLTESCDQLKGKTVLPMSTNELSDNVNFFFNSRGSWIEKLVVNDAHEFPGSQYCTSNPLSRSVSFDVICSISFQSITIKRSENQRITLFRKPKNSSMRVDEFVIRY